MSEQIPETNCHETVIPDSQLLQMLADQLESAPNEYANIVKSQAWSAGFCSSEPLGSPNSPPIEDTVLLRLNYTLAMLENYIEITAKSANSQPTTHQLHSFQAYDGSDDTILCTIYQPDSQSVAQPWLSRVAFVDMFRSLSLEIR